MLKDFFTHVCVVITFLFIGGSAIRHHTNPNSIQHKVLFGIFNGVLGSILMFVSIQLTPTIIIDLRHISIFLSAFYGGFLSSIISFALISLTRILLISGTPSSLLVSVGVLFTISILSPLITSRLNLSPFIKWTVMSIYSMIAYTCGFLYLLGFSPQTYRVLFYYWIINTIALIFVYYTSQHIVNSNRMFHELSMQSKVDFLTGLHNVRHFDTSLNNFIEKANQNKEEISLILIDIDHFKKVNDTYGHPVGDEVLRQLGAILSSCSRSKDIVCRNGGEEFSILVNNSSLFQALELAERVRTAVEKHTFILPNGTEIHLTVSLGVSTYNVEMTTDSEQLIKQADKNLYHAKQSGRNKVCPSLTN